MNLYFHIPRKVVVENMSHINDILATFVEMKILTLTVSRTMRACYLSFRALLMWIAWVIISFISDDLKVS